MERLREAAWNTLIVVAVVAWLAFLWFAPDWFAAPSCDPQANYTHCETPSGSGPGNK
jgi:hypothetical protein